jgi:hypothetical protein
MRATYNAIGSTKRNGPSKKRYGFLADMRLKLAQKFQSYFREQYRIDSGGKSIRNLTCERRWMLISAYGKAWCSRNRRYTVTHYGKSYVLNVARPYCVILCAMTNRVVGVMPLSTDMRLRHFYS